MKKNYSITAKFFTGAALAVALAFSSFAQSERPVPSTVLRVVGNARCSVDGGATWKLLKAGDIIYASALIQTAVGSDVDLLLGEQVKAPKKGTTFNPESRPCHFVSLAADTVLKLEKAAHADAVEEILLELRTGTINGSVKKMEAGSKYEVSFAGGIAGMREAIYRLSSGGQLNVMKGKAFVAMNNSADVKVVEAGGELAPKTPATAAVVAPAPTATPAVAAPASVHAQPATPITTTKESTGQRVPLPRSGLRRAAP